MGVRFTRKLWVILTIAAMVAASLAGAYVYGIFVGGPGVCALTQRAAINLPDVAGRIDHMAFDPSTGRLYVAEFGNNSVAVVNTNSQSFERSVQGFSSPQGVVFVPATGELYVTNGGTGVVDVYSAPTLLRTANLTLGSDADNIRYEGTTNTVYVGYGEGGIAGIDATTHEILGRMQLAGHPEGFQVSSGVVYANVPTSGYVAVGNLSTYSVTDRWPIAASGNFPMAIDPAGGKVLVGVRNPALLMVMSAKDGRQIANISIGQDPDDVYFDGSNHCVYVSSGSGYVMTAKESDSGALQEGVQLTTYAGARTSFLAPDQGLYFVAAPAMGSEPAKIIVFSLA